MSRSFKLFVGMFVVGLLLVDSASAQVGVGGGSRGGGKMKKGKGGGSSGGFAGGGGEMKLEKAEPKAIKIEEANSNLDADQKKAGRDLLKMFNKIFTTTEEIPAEAVALVKDTMFLTLDGVHSPRRPAVDGLGDLLVGHLKSHVVTDNDAYKVVADAAETLGGEVVSRNAIDDLITEVKTVANRSKINGEERDALIKAVRELVVETKTNKARIAKREAEKKALMAKMKKDEEAKKKKEETAVKRKKGGGGDESGGQ
jgi:hypothetical protein